METLKSFVEQLKQRISIVDVVGRVVPLKPKGKNFWGCCPFHNEKTPSFSVNEEMGIYKCFGCGEGGDAITFLMKKNNLPYMDALRELSDIAGVNMPQFKSRDAEEEKREISYYEILGQASKIYADSLPGSAAEEYLARRTIPADVQKKYMLGYAARGNVMAQRFGESGIAAGLVRRGKDNGALYDFFRNRLMFPILSARGNVVAFSGRSLDGSEPKYINIAETEFFQKRRTLFGIHFALGAIRQSGRAIIVEGQIDCIRMQTSGFLDTVAPLGTALTSEHIEILKKYAKELVFCFDGDAAGQKAAGRAASLVMPLLNAEMTIKFAFMPDGKDPDEVLSAAKGVGVMDKIITSAKLIPDFAWELANKNFLIATESGRVRADKWLRAEYEKIGDLRLRNEYLKTLDNREWDEWNKYRHTVKPKMEAPDPSKKRIAQIAEIKRKYPDLYESNFELLGTIDAVPPADTGMTREYAEKIIKSMGLEYQLKSLIVSHARPDEIQKIKDQILDLWG
jgi:DNA primase